MATTVRLLPSSYEFSNTSYLTGSNLDNMYTNVDSSTYATVNHGRTATTAYYIYLRGFDFSQIPANAVISSAIVKIKARVNSASSFTPALYNSTTTAIGNMDSTIGTTATTVTTDITSSWSTIKGYGDNFGIRLSLNRSNRNTASSMYIYGAEITVTYELPVIQYTVTSSSTGPGSINPNGTTQVDEGSEFNLVISPNENCTFTITDNGVDKTSLFEQRAANQSYETNIASYTTSGSITGTYYQNAVGQGSNTSSTSTNNDYCPSSGSTATIYYAFDVSSIPSTATIEAVSCTVAGHAENPAQSTAKSTCQLYTGTTEKGDSTNFTSQSNSVITVNGGSSWTRAELDNVKLGFTIGYYGGLVNGATLLVTYSTLNEGDKVYTIAAVTENHTIAVTFSDVTATPEEGYWVKINGAWKQINIVYKKVDGAWVVWDYTYSDSNKLVYLGNIASSNITTVGSVSDTDHSITVSGIDAGTYTLYYENADGKLQPYDAIGTVEVQ